MNFMLVMFPREDAFDIFFVVNLYPELVHLKRTHFYNTSDVTVTDCLKSFLYKMNNYLTFSFLNVFFAQKAKYYEVRRYNLTVKFNQNNNNIIYLYLSPND